MVSSRTADRPLALAAFSHHSALRRQSKARAGEEGHEEHDALRRQKPPPPQPELFSLEEEPGGGLPAPLSEVAGRQDKVVRHVLEDLGTYLKEIQEKRKEEIFLPKNEK